MAFYAERLRLDAQAAREAAGENLWTSALEASVRAKVVLAFEDQMPPWSRAGSTEAIRHIGEAIEYGVAHALGRLQTPPFKPGVMSEDDPVALTYIEVASTVLVNAQGASSLLRESGTNFMAQVNRIFNAHRVAFRLADSTLVPLGSEELFVAVIDPVLHLLHGRPEFAGADNAYRKALDEIKNNDAGDAITDAATALQEALRASGHDGNALGDQVKAAKKAGLLGPTDHKMTDAIADVVVWAATVRNAGEAHRWTEPELSDAWLMVHVVGALIVRLAEGGNRGVPQV